MKEKIYEVGPAYDLNFFLLTFWQIAQLILIVAILYYAVRMYRKLDKFLNKRI